MIKVLVADDSAFMRQTFKKMINQDSELNVVDTVRNGEQALERLNKLKPDVITLDIEMPKKNGIETLKEIKQKNKDLPVIMISAVDNRQTVMEALQKGAFDFIPKPSGTISLDIEDIQQQIIKKIKVAYQSKSEKKQKKEIKSKTANFKTKSVKKTDQKNFSLIVIGASSGGPKALKKVITKLPSPLPAALIIVQHMPEGFTSSLAGHLNQEASFPIKEAEEGDWVKSGQGLLAPGNFHLKINKNKKIELNQQPKKWGVRPCVDHTMISAAHVYQEQVIGVILTGMGHDGARGMEEIKKYQGHGIVEARETALVYGMPSSTIEKNAYNQILPLYDIPTAISRLLTGTGDK